MTLAALYVVLTVAAACAAAVFSYLAGYQSCLRQPCTCLPIVLEPAADRCSLISPAEYGARTAMEEITFSEIEALGQLAERTFGHTWERLN